jgi:hypothetical protein
VRGWRVGQYDSVDGAFTGFGKHARTAWEVRGLYA